LEKKARMTSLTYWEREYLLNKSKQRKETLITVKLYLETDFELKFVQGKENYQRDFTGRRIYQGSRVPTYFRPSFVTIL